MRWRLSPDGHDAQPEEPEEKVDDEDEKLEAGEAAGERHLDQPPVDLSPPT